MKYLSLSLALAPVAVAAAAVVGCSDDPAPLGPVADAGLEAAAADDGRAPLEAGGCSAAVDELMKPVATVSEGEVRVLEEKDGAALLYVDATAGGTQGASTRPRVYVDLAARRRVETSDVDARTDTSWDLSLERTVLFTNGGQGGSGEGAAAWLPGKDFAAVTAADASGLATETFVDEACAPRLDDTGSVRSTFDGWYAYDTATHKVTPAKGAFLVRGGRGALFRVQVLEYYASEDGGVGMAGGRYLLRVGTL